MSENVRVIVRCRPMNSKEEKTKCKNLVEIEGCVINFQNPTDLSGPKKSFKFDNCYGSDTTTQMIYNDICYSLVENVLEGYNGTIFAYGQTGCGKSYTMQGPENFANPIPNAVDSNFSNLERGIIPRSFEHIFEAISVATNVRYLALVSFLEIYNENIRDLLNSNDELCAPHQLKELPGGEIVIPTLTTHTVHNVTECFELLNLGNKNRHIAATMMNAHSSRSHTIFSLILEQITSDKDFVATDTKCENDNTIRCGKLNLVDLAGSERQNKTGAFGERLKEATKINLSLSALGNVISALVDGRTKYVPYRDSKLTRILQDSLGGNTKTLMIACISPADYNYDETISTLRYASRAKNISNKPKINEDPKDAKLRVYQEEIMNLKKMLDESHNQLTQINIAKQQQNNNNTEIDEWLAMERAKLKLEMQTEFERFQPKELNEILQNQRTTHTNSEDAAAETINTKTDFVDIQLEAHKRIESIKKALIGGERANDMQLKASRQKKKIDAQKRLSALAHAISRIEQTDDRDFLQGHYTNIHQELNAKNESLKIYRQKVKALEQEVSDLHAEFQLDRADYLETIRRLERNLKFFQQILDTALPILRKGGKYWDFDEILQNSIWNDDLKIWKLPELLMNSFKLPLATTDYYGKHLMNKIKSHHINNNNENKEYFWGKQDSKNELKVESEDFESKDDIYKNNILNNYFRTNSQKSTELLQKYRSLQNVHQRANTENLLTTNSLAKMKKNFDLEKKISTTKNTYFIRSTISPQRELLSKTWSGITKNNITAFDENFKKN